jgi:hypothetical protein
VSTDNRTDVQEQDRMFKSGRAILKFDCHAVKLHHDNASYVMFSSSIHNKINIFTHIINLFQLHRCHIDNHVKLPSVGLCALWVHCGLRFKL